MKTLERGLGSPINSDNCDEFANLSHPSLIHGVKESGTPGGTRTPDARLRTPSLYPTELQGQNGTRLIRAGSNYTPSQCGGWAGVDQSFEP